MQKYVIYFTFFFFYYINNDVLPVNAIVTPKCMGCICEAISNCDLSKGCLDGNVCGPFRITWAYWADGGKPTVDNQNPEDISAYGKCASDPGCSSIAVQGYMKKYGQDCNGDGKIDCDDFAAIHKLGGYGCRAPLPDFYTSRYDQCKKLVGDLNTA